MKQGPHFNWLVYSLLVAGLCLAAGSRYLLMSLAPVEVPDNNPDKFRLWTSNSGYQYTFTYDPHAADAWLFRGGSFPTQSLRLDFKVSIEPP